MPRVLRQLGPLVLLMAGCADDPVFEADPPPVDGPVATAFDPARSGTISGQVRWTGPVPTPPPFLHGVPHPDGRIESRLIPNPNRPNVQAESGGVASAVVFLRGVPPHLAKPWDWPPSRIELTDCAIAVVQGERRSRVGFVRRGEAVAMAAPGPEFHVLRARGAAFFSVPFPDPGLETRRTLDSTGRVELSSGAGYYWATAHLFVDDHPYYTVTDSDGRFTLTQVPEGRFDVVAWLPNWTVARQERDPESGLITRQSYGPPLESHTSATISAGGATTLTITLP